MESQHYFKVYYEKNFALSVVAHTKWEAIEKVYQKMILEYQNVERCKMSAKKVY